MHKLNNYSSQNGFTLMELMVVAAMIAILAAIAIQAYNGYIETSKQATGRANIGTAKILLEDFFLDNASYAGVDDNLGNVGWANEGGFTTALTAKSATGYTIRSTASTGEWAQCVKDRTAPSFTCTTSP